MELSNLINKALGAAEDIKEKLADPSGTIVDATDMVFNNLNHALPYLAKAGYIMSELEVEIGAPPKLIPHFVRDETCEIDDDYLDAAFEDNPVGYALFKTLLNAAELQKKIAINDMNFARIEIELGLIPCARICYKKA